MSDKVEKKKQPYKKPSVKVVELAADEVLAVGCKTNISGSGGKGKVGVGSCVFPACSTNGS